MITLDHDSPTPPYEQIRSQIAAQATDGHLPVGTRLPTVRRLAEDLGLAVNTVARAYRELETTGVVETRGRAGTFVTAQGDESRAQLENAARSYASLVHRLGIRPTEAVAIVTTAIAGT